MHRLWPFLMFCAVFHINSFSWSQTVSDNQKMIDAGLYSELLVSIKDASIEEQVDGLRNFLENHPKTSFREEIETNLKNLDQLLIESDPRRKREERDAEKYLRVVEYANKLSQEDQISLWEQFLEENPKSMYRREIFSRLKELRGTVSPPRLPAAKKDVVQIGDKPEMVARKLELKDGQKALLLATFAGLFVPGMGHWYARDYTIAGILTGLRVGGLAIGIPAITQRNSPMIVVGALLAGFSYLADIIDTPFAIQRFNDKVEDKASPQTSLSPRDNMLFLASVNITF